MLSLCIDTRGFYDAYVYVYNSYSLFLLYSELCVFGV